MRENETTRCRHHREFAGHGRQSRRRLPQRGLARRGQRLDDHDGDPDVIAIEGDISDEKPAGRSSAAPSNASGGVDTVVNKAGVGRETH
jgi:NAD(P)-dependent dehydrogenase (short-subunit alcohol dehydrogenase family)